MAHVLNILMIISMQYNTIVIFISSLNFSLLVTPQTRINMWKNGLQVANMFEDCFEVLILESIVPNNEELLVTLVHSCAWSYGDTKEGENNPIHRRCIGGLMKAPIFSSNLFASCANLKNKLQLKTLLTFRKNKRHKLLQRIRHLIGMGSQLWECYIIAFGYMSLLLLEGKQSWEGRTVMSPSRDIF